MKNIIKNTTLAAVVMGAVIQPAIAHRAWFLPSTTVLSGEAPWVTIDAAVSNNLFFPNHRAISPDSIKVTDPDGKPLEIQGASEGKIRTTFDLQLPQTGTYVISSGRSSFGAAWKEGEERKRWRGTLEQFKKEGLAKKPGIQLSDSTSRIVTYVTAGKPNKTALATTGKGLEIDFTHIHPNDLFSGEAATFTLLIDGKPAADTEVTIVKGNDRFRNDAGEEKIKTNAKGEFTYTWPTAGRYWLTAQVSSEQDKVEGVPFSKRASFSATFEVLPE
ncbi:ABC transporter permease [Oceaniferula spumae]|uniref:ABC transporter permease n=1 Tax=Oceaniferula spumae TaxID=2979115 RepID=A0AAT9FQN0_9BACT